MDIESVIDIPENIKLIDNSNGLLNIYNHEFVDLVEKEAKLIKKHFSKKQISKLIASKIDGTSVQECIYGTMVGSCNHPDVAKFMITNLDTLITDDDDYSILDANRRSYQSILSPLEVYISPTDEEELDAVEEDDIVSYPDSYYHRISEVVKWITN
jgi:hypothetical protein